jgi:anthranilate synthase component 1
MIPLNPSHPAFLEQAASANVIPVWTEIVADGDTPVSAFAKIGGEAPAFLLESAEQNDQVGRYSFLGAGARVMISARDKIVTITENGRSRTFESARDPLDELQKVMSGYRPAGAQDLPGFHGGVVGYLGYDCVRWFEPTIPPPRKDELGIPDMCFLLTEQSLFRPPAKKTEGRRQRVCRSSGRGSSLRRGRARN